MPGCNARTCTCELDHIEPFDGTNTTETNLHGLCCRHHHAKHDYGWTVEVDEHRVTRWTSPNRRRYDKPPDPWPESPLLNRRTTTGSGPATVLSQLDRVTPGEMQ